MSDLHRGPASSANDGDERIDLSHELDLAAERPNEDRLSPSKATPTFIALSVVAASLVTAFSVDAIRAWHRSEDRAEDVVEPAADAPHPGTQSVSATVVDKSSPEAAAIEDGPSPAAVVGRAVGDQTVIATDAGSPRVGVTGTSSRPRPPRAGGLSTLPQLEDDMTVPAEADEPVDEDDARDDPDESDGPDDPDGDQGDDQDDDQDDDQGDDQDDDRDDGAEPDDVSSKSD